MALIGYARVSSTGQSLEVQLKKLTDFGCTGGDNRIFKEKKSGTSTASRKAFQDCMKHLRQGDTLVVTRLDRLARSTLDLVTIAADLDKRGINFTVIEQGVDTSTPTGKLMFTMLAAIAEFENEIRRERQADGIHAAKEKGIQFGAKPKLTNQQIAEMKEKRIAGVKIKDLMQEYSISKASVYRLLNEEAEA